MKKVGDKLYDFRILNNLTQEQLGEKIGVTRQTISLWEAGRREISLEYLKHICEVFNLDLSYFLGNEVDCKDLQLQNDEIGIVACAEAPDDSEQIATQDVVIEQKQNKVRKSISNKTLIGIIIVAAIISVIAVILGRILDPPPIDGFGTVNLVMFNFGIESVSWIIFTVAIVVAVAVGTILIVRKIKHNKQKN